VLNNALNHGNAEEPECVKEEDGALDSMDAKDAGSDENGGDEHSGQGQQGYKYLLKLPMDSVSEENVKKLLNEKEKKEKELSELTSKTVEQMWVKDLEELEVEYNKFIEATTYTYSATSESMAKAAGGSGGGGKAKKVKAK
jgi:DNA topoisomerase-2